MAKKSASQLAVQAEYLAKNNIIIAEVKPQKKGGKKKRTAVIITSHKVVGYGLNESEKDFRIYISSVNTCAPIREMGDEDIIKVLIKDYELVLKHIVQPDIMDNPVYIKDFIKKNGMNEGVCRYSRTCIGVSITSREWVEEFVDDGRSYWCEIPDNCWESKDLILCISKRLEILTEILNSFL